MALAAEAVAAPSQDDAPRQRVEGAATASAASVRRIACLTSTPAKHRVESKPSP